MKIHALALTGALAFLASPAPACAQAPEHVVFVVRLGADTLAVENASISAAHADAVMRMKSPLGRVTQSIDLSARGGFTLSRATFGRGARGDSAVQGLSITVRGDSITAEQSIDGKAVGTSRGVLPPDAVPFVNLSGTSLELILRRARIIGGDTARVIALAAGAPPFTTNVVLRGADSATIVIGAAVLVARTDARGHLLGAAVPSQGVVFERLPADSPAAAWTPVAPSYAAPPGAPYSARSITLRTPAGLTLAGTLTQSLDASAASPAVVLITGSGSQDRDEAFPSIGGLRPFRDIADTLSRRGIAVLRLDDRGVGGSDRGPATATSADFADDIRAGVAWLRTQPGIDPARIGLVGHSEGGIIAPMIAVTDPTLRAIALIAGPAKSGRQISEFQRRDAFARIPGLTQHQRDSLFIGSSRVVDSMIAAPGWWHFFGEHDPLVTARKVRVPTLILQGETDRQVTPDQAKMLADAMRAGGNARVEVVLFPRMNHLLVEDRSGDPEGYSALRAPVVRKDFLGTLADWLSVALR